MSCSAPVKTILSVPVFDLEGHRGCRGLMPENTIPAMIKAVELGVTTLEMDVVVTKDRKLILSHEPFFNHEITTKPDGKPVSAEEERSLNIYQMTYEETRRYDVGMKNHPRFRAQEKIAVQKPLLADVIDAVSSKMPFFNIETKTTVATDNIYHPSPEEFVELLMEVIYEKKIAPYVTIQSFDFRTLQYLHAQYPSIHTAMLIEDYDRTGFEEQLKKLGFTPTVYSPHYSLVSKELVDKCHALNIKVIPWTVNSLGESKRLKALGVDGYITDYPGGELSE